MADWVYIDAAVLRAARERAGLSYETMARQIPVSSKTWERWEKAGRVPPTEVGKVAAVLDLEIEQPARARVELAYDDKPSVEEAIGRLAAEIRAGFSAADRRMDTVLVPRLEAIEAALRTLAEASTVAR